MMQMFLVTAIHKYAKIIAGLIPIFSARMISTFKDGPEWVACAQHILLQREADDQAAEDEIDKE